MTGMPVSRPFRPTRRASRRARRAARYSMRSVPSLITLRPADANEVTEAYRVIAGLKRNPAALALSRQPLPTFDRSRYAAASGTARGAYVLADCARPEVILIGTGSEVRLCV